MNWINLKAKFPKAYDEIKQYSIDNNITGRLCLYQFLDSKGYPYQFTRIGQLKDYSKRLQ